MRLIRVRGVPFTGEALRFGVRPYSTVGVSLRLMAFTITYQTTAVTITVKTNQISKLVMSFILPLAAGDTVLSDPQPKSTPRQTSRAARSSALVEWHSTD